MNPEPDDHPAATKGVAQAGLTYLLIYCALFAGFLLLNVFDAPAMQDTILPLPMGRYVDLHGLNLALVYGIFLILAAMALALMYLRRTRPGRNA